MEPGETGEECILRECQEELGITLRVQREFTDVMEEYPSYTVHLRFYLCDSIAGIPQKKEHNALAWVTPQELALYAFCPADRKMLERNGHLLDSLL